MKINDPTDGWMDGCMYEKNEIQTWMDTKHTTQ